MLDYRLKFDNPKGLIGFIGCQKTKLLFANALRCMLWSNIQSFLFLCIIGEAVTQLPKEIKEKYNNVPWKDIQDFRIVVAHRYWKVNQVRIWDIVKNKLDTLEQQIKGILKKEMNKK